ncbi:MAG: PGF-pre-PGF domain-containing protein [Candidatus Methanoperedens sp.]|nr:PGF-pre-PGF domain-containing protein [Candidatus Methanoperedens sp.]
MQENVNAGEIGTSVEVLKNTSSLVKTPAPGNVYMNANIWAKKK